MINFHPDQNTLAEYSAAEAVGSQDSYDEKASFESLMAKIRAKENAVAQENEETIAADPARVYQIDHLPKVVQKLVNGQQKINWKSLSPSLKQARLKTGQAKFEVCLHKIRKGGAVAKHDHKGLEVTIVLDGAFSDEKGTYRKGDFLLREPGESHRPTATRDQDCLCLSMISAPVKLSGLMGKIINPFLRISPS